MAEANPESGADVTDEASAVTRIATLLEPEGPTEQDSDNKPEANQEEPEAEIEASSEEKADPEPDGEGEELPDTLEGFAEALGVPADELAGHLKVPVKVDGKVRHVTLAEAMAGQQRDADYRQKTTELAEQRRQIEAQNQQALERWQQEFQRLNAAIESLEAESEAELSPERQSELLESDPQEYLRVMARQQARKVRLDQAKAENQEALQQYQAQQQQQLGSYRAEQQRLLSEKMPEISDAKKLAAFEQDMDSYLSGLGYSSEEIARFTGGAFDHRHVLIVRNAMKFEALQKGKAALPRKLSGLGKVQKPGAASEKPSDTDKLVAGRNRLQQLRTKGTRQQQNDAAVKYVKGLL